MPIVSYGLIHENVVQDKRKISIFRDFSVHYNHHETEDRHPRLQPLPHSTSGNCSGGAHRVADYRGVGERGYPVTLYAAGDAKTRARLVSVTKRASINDPKIGMANHKAYEFIQTSNAYRDAAKWGAKVMLSHVPMVSAYFAAFAKFPTVALLHSPPTFTDSAVMASAPAQKYISISNNQRKLAKGAKFIATIYHGVDTKALHFQSKPGTYLAFLGRIRDYKGVAEAIATAQTLRVPLKIAYQLATLTTS